MHRSPRMPLGTRRRFVACLLELAGTKAPTALRRRGKSERIQAVLPQPRKTTVESPMVAPTIKSPMVAPYRLAAQVDDSSPTDEPPAVAPLVVSSASVPVVSIASSLLAATAPVAARGSLVRSRRRRMRRLLCRSLSELVTLVCVMALKSNL